MWFIDLYHDIPWAVENVSTVEPKVSTITQFESQPGLRVETLIFGTEFEVKHVRIIVNVGSKNEIEQFQARHLNKLILILETNISLAMREPFHFYRSPNQPSYLITYGEYDPNKKPTPPKVEITKSRALPINYHALGSSLGSHFPGFEPYLYFLQRGTNTSLDLDYRWLSFYRLCEYHFAKNRKKKIYDLFQWREFLKKFESKLLPLRRNSKQSLYGLMDDLRSLVAHSVVGNDSFYGNPVDKKSNKRISDSFLVLEEMVLSIINEHPNNKNFKLELRR